MDDDEAAEEPESDGSSAERSARCGHQRVPETAPPGSASAASRDHRGLRLRRLRDHRGYESLRQCEAIGTGPASWSNPQEFRPERFSSGGDGYVRWGECFGFVPFGGGWRICPGINFGLAVVELVLANLLYCFDWEARLVKGEELDVEEEAFGFAVHRKRPLLSGGQRL
ncbi:hypothetical protein B296_00003364 [Ensete ventricosum]|uniref:Cytochrome P450 n=1 Tax=Ensete ventricosum TaxID=4639 RepID=A0A426ZFE3_ENSVE|nr:hypothetical protein B296_00003364 [Ensete ventricosum]